MAEKITIPLELKTDQASATLKNVKGDIKDATVEQGLFAKQTDMVKKAFSGLKGGIRKVIGAFKTLKGAVAATGIGALVLIFTSLIQYFKDSEEGASKLKEMTSQLGVVFGNLTDILSNVGKALFGLFTGDFKAMKEAIGDATDQILNFGKNARTEMAQAKQLEKDRLALQQFERKAMVDKAKTEAEMMKLRLQSRDVEKFTNEERLGFMRQANKLADEQLAKDLHVAEEKLRMQQLENSFSKSSQENLDAEAQLEAQIFQIQRANFSERKRMKSEEQALVKQAEAEQKKADDAILKAEAEKQKAIEATAKAEAKAAKDKIAADEAAVALTKANTQMQIAAYGQLAGALGALAGENKQLAVAEALIQTYLGANKAFGQGGVAGFVTGAAVIAAGLANVKNIMKTEVPGGGATTGGSNVPSIGSGVAAGIPRNTNLDDVVGSINGQNNSPIRAYVIGQDVTDSQEAQSYLNRQRTL